MRSLFDTLQKLGPQLKQIPNIRSYFGSFANTPPLNSPKVWEFDLDHQRWLPVAELSLPEDKSDQVHAVAWAPYIGSIWSYRFEVEMLEVVSMLLASLGGVVSPPFTISHKSYPSSSLFIGVNGADFSKQLRSLLTSLLPCQICQLIIQRAEFQNVIDLVTKFGNASCMSASISWNPQRNEVMQLSFVLGFNSNTSPLNSPKVWEFDLDHQRWLPVAELSLPEDKSDQVHAVAWAPNIGRYCCSINS
ncbi:hypothetical protein OROGR_007526 [Orobanche gracilis]